MMPWRQAELPVALKIPVVLREHLPGAMSAKQENPPDIVIAQQWASCSRYRLAGKVQSLCPRNYQPVCGTDSVTYPNECSLCREVFRNRVIDKKHDGRCVKLNCTGYLRSSGGRVRPCTLEYMPVCGTNGITYRNKCSFCDAVANGLDVNVRSMGECFQRIDCRGWNTNAICAANYNPHCGSNGKTYGNKCQFCKAVVQSKGTLFFKHHGPC
ncbi:PREDICTED: double-headed protease inhibitor, submandibular gland-like [Nipponia nippon]|uniref:double-headed protease inhibitor, submandibular gland-like n=1 Tax=Nipponia nippon TaxID=128390 RepID=UPI000511B377|nr:PREDICTED: double-headed protease inhibitor, submandibular gland-like [Nipponia nippon]